MIKEKIKTFSKEEAHLLTVVAVVLALSVAIFFIFSFIFSFVHENNSVLEMKQVESILYDEVSNLLSDAKEIDESGVLDIYIESRDSLSLISITTEEARARRVGGILVTDENGIALSRTRGLTHRGDYVFHTTDWGQKLSAGESVASIEKGAIWPIIMVGATPLIRDGEMLGSVIVANILDSNYASFFKERNFVPEGHIAFYSKEEGIVGSSLGDDAERLVDSYFNTASEWILSGRSGDKIKLDGEYYFVHNIPFAGIEDVPGGALVFFPQNHEVQAFLVGIWTAVIFAITMFFVYRRFVSHSHEGAHHLVYVFIGALFIFFISFFGAKFMLDRAPPDFSEPVHLIYNATMRVNPEAGIIDRNFEHRVAVEIFPGGEVVNAAQFELGFDPETVRVADIITTASFCEPGFFVDRTIDNEEGFVSVICGTSQGFSGSRAVVAEIIFQPLEEGLLELVFNDEKTEVKAHDGLATDVLRSTSNASFRVVDSGSDLAEGLSFPLIFSPTHSNSLRWYNSADVWFSWLPEDGMEYRYVFSKDGEVHGEGLVSEGGVRVFAPEDGSYLFSLMPVADGEDVFSDSEESIVNIETTPPTPPIIKASETSVSVGDIVRLEFSAEDNSLSGLQSGFYIRRGDGVLFPVGHRFDTVFERKGVHTITVRVFDNAGNWSESSLDIDVR